MDGFYYPSLACAIDVSLFAPNGDKKSVMASHDHMTAGSDDRHYIDLAFWEALVGDEARSSLVPPVPACWHVQVKETKCSVLGMLRAPLQAQVRNGDKRSCLQLGGVVVVDTLPVPFHLSIKRVFRSTDRQTQQIIHDRLNMGQTNFPFKIDTFTEEYHNHPYWTSNVISIGMSADFHQRKDFMQTHVEPTTSWARRCDSCGSAGNLKKCKACKKAFYCSRDCQVADWKGGHKSLCKQLRAKVASAALAQISNIQTTQVNQAADELSAMDF